MSTTQALLQQRAHGEVHLEMSHRGLLRLREVGSSKVRLPPASNTAYLINTAGGLAGGDSFSSQVTLGAASKLTITTQAAERVYRSLGPAASVATHFKIEDSAVLYWLPHETILFDGAALDRRIWVDMAESSRFLGIETTVFGREASGETVRNLSFREEWQLRRGGKLIHADTIKFGPHLPSTKATIANARAIATIILIDASAATKIDQLRALLPENCGTSAWNGKLVARLLASDSLKLKKIVASALSVLAAPSELPKTWTI